MANVNGFPLLSKRALLETFTPPDWLIDGVLQRRFVYSLTGQTGHAKTAIALLLSELVSSVGLANPALGVHAVNKGQVIYLVGENPDDVIMRLIGADSLRTDDPLSDRIQFVLGVVNLAQAWDACATDAPAEGYDLVIVDTSAAYFLGADENANTELGDHARLLRSYTALPGGPAVLALCHPRKFVGSVEELIPRGGGAFLAEMDGNLTLRRIAEGMVELHHNKIRGPGFEPILLRLEKITCQRLVDAKGKQITTVRAVVASEIDAQREEHRVVEDEDRGMIVMLAEPDLSVAEIADRCHWFYGNGDPDKSRVQRMLGRLEKDHLVKKIRTKWQLTENGKVIARKTALRADRIG